MLVAWIVAFLVIVWYLFSKQILRSLTKYNAHDEKFPGAHQLLKAIVAAVKDAHLVIMNQNSN